MMNLFDDMDPPISRNSDPETSHDAAADLTASGARSRMASITLAGLRENPGLTSKELEKLLGFEDGAIRKRLNDLRHLKLADNGPERRCSITGKTAQTWVPRDSGEAAGVLVATQGE